MPVRGLESATFAEMLAYLTLHLPACVPLRLDPPEADRTLTDAEGWLGWARRVVADEGGGYALGVQRESVGEVYEACRRQG